MQASQAVSQPALKRSDSLLNNSPKLTSPDASTDQHQSPIEFSIQPNVVKIPAGPQAVMLMVSAKLKNSYQLAAAANDAQIQRRNSEPLEELKQGATAPELRKAVSDVRRLRRMLTTNIEKYNHLLVGKVRDTNMMFSFIVEASIIDTDQHHGGAAAQQQSP